MPTLIETARDPRGRSATRSRLADYSDLAKLRLTSLVVVTAGMGYLLGSRGAPDLAILFFTVLGTLLLSGGACALNQWVEVGPDARMDRTRDRPLPSGRVSRSAAFFFGLVLLGLGGAILFRRVGPIPAWLGLLSAGIYLFLYTPLKRVTSLNTLFGAVVGALPPIMGFSAATGRLDAGALLPAGILFLWQIPHFLAIAWLYREDYLRGGFRMLSGEDESGRATAVMILVYSLALVPVSVAAAAVARTGWLYPVGAFLLSLGLVVLAGRFCRDRSSAAARTLFLASLVYLPLLFSLMVFDPTAPGALPG